MKFNENTINSNRIFSLDVLRILATLCILFYHFQQVFGFRASGIIDFCDFFNGSLIVEFFFVLSGFLAFHDVTGLLGDKSYTSYVKKKISRLIPVIIMPCITYTIICLLMRSMTGNGGWYFDTVVDIPATILASMGIHVWGVIDVNPVNYPLWYVDVLLLCFIVLGLLVKLSKRLKISPVFSFIGMIFLGIILWNNSIQIPFFNEQIGRGYYAFFWGILLGYFYEDIVNKEKKSVVMLIFTIALFLISQFLPIFKADWFGDNARYIFTFIAYPSLILTFLHPYVQRLFDFKALGYVGKVTYDIYAWHLVVYLLFAFLLRLGVFNFEVQSYHMMVLYAVAAAVVGFVSYHFIDRFTVWLLHKLIGIFK